ncbi:DUF5597 domain-containing protein [Acetobacteraceae bacterium KSS8]|uniref:DUF5597 domain-containing protein n=1 Tax=Endosaccharibacter trunci TaxID=2812733 RepID=A0ABT1W8L1_9PROT|nr:DUF5597 domain-containing protein [Acetobacteraceae bacterium KSS8]
MRNLLLATATLLGLSGAARAATPPPPAPAFVDDGHGRMSLRVDGKPFLVLAGQPHNSSAWPDRMGAVWAAADAMALNTLEAPVYWQTLEPQPGRFDFTETDMLVHQARAHRKRLALLWFGTWKNGAMGYVPDWIKQDRQHYPRLRDADGNETANGLSPFGAETLARDEAAFGALMRHLRAIDAAQHTVILVQVENESGQFGTVRDHTEAANAAFASPVPDAVLRAMRVDPKGGHPNWRDAFGARADECFAAWSVSRYVNAVAQAGHAADPLPLYANVWLRYRGLTQPGTDYPSGGGVWTVLPIWKAMTPAIGVLGTDVYTNSLAEFRKGVLPYDRPDNVPFVSESGITPATARWVFDTLARGGIGASQFGIDHQPGDPDLTPALVAHGRNNRLLGPMAAFLADAARQHRISALIEDPGAPDPQTEIGDWRITASFGAEWGKPSPTTAPLDALAPGRALVVPIDATHLLIAGMSARIELQPKDDAAGPHEVLRVEEGHLTDSGWSTDRILNGDETDYGISLDPQGEAVRVTLGP